MPEEKVFDYILTMFSMLDGRWLPCERLSFLHHLLIFCLYLTIFVLFIMYVFVVLLRLRLFIVCIKAPATSQRCSTFFSFIYRTYVQVFLGMKTKLKWAGVYYGKKLFGKVKKLLLSNFPNPKVFSKSKDEYNNNNNPKVFLKLKSDETIQKFF